MPFVIMTPDLIWHVMRVLYYPDATYCLLRNKNISKYSILETTGIINDDKATEENQLLEFTDERY